MKEFNFIIWPELVLFSTKYDFLLILLLLFFYCLLIVSCLLSCFLPTFKKVVGTLLKWFKDVGWSDSNKVSCIACGYPLSFTGVENSCLK